MTWLFNSKNTFKGEPLERRADDNAEALVKRLEQYHNLTAPLVTYYGEKGLHKEIDASLPSGEVTKKLFEVCESIRKNVNI